MDVSIVLLVLFSAIFAVQSLECPGDHTDIRFPFRIKGKLQSQHIGCHPSFELLCQSNRTMVRFPGFRDLAVKSISYHPKTLISLLDPKNCVPEVFLNLNLSQTPFRYSHKTEEYTYLTCSETVSGLEQVPCLSSIDNNHHHVYVVESSFKFTPAAASSCKASKTVHIPFAYNSYISDNSFGLELTWDFTNFRKGGYEDEAKPAPRSSESRFNGKVLVVVAGVAALVLMAGIAISVTLKYRLEESDKKKEHKLHEDCEKLLI